MFGFFNRERETEPDKVVIRTSEQKEKAKAMQKEKQKCPVCGKDPIGGEYHLGIAIAVTDGSYNYITCTHCNTDYKYKR